LPEWFVNDPVRELPLAIWCLGEIRNLSGFEQLGFTLFVKAGSYLCWSKPRLKGLLPWNLAELVQATSEIGSRWPGRPSTLEWMYAQTSKTKKWNFSSLQTYSGLREFGQFVVLTSKDRAEAMEFCVNGEPYWTRQGAVQALADRWPDAATRELLNERAVQDEHINPRIAALQSLAEKWPDETTRSLLCVRAVQDESEWPRRAAIKSLAEKWPDGRTRKALHNCAVNDKNKEPRIAALESLAEKWPDDSTRELLNKRVVQEEDDDLRYTALKALAEKWPDEATRKLLAERAVSDDQALWLLAKAWPDENTYQLLQDLAIQANRQSSTRDAALDVLLDAKWPAEIIRELLFEREIRREREDRWGNFQGLAQRWPDEITRRLLLKALKDEHEWPRFSCWSAIGRTRPRETCSSSAPSRIRTASGRLPLRSDAT
jgi:hypothetical protein